MDTLSIRRELEEKSNNALISIWKENDRTKYTDEYFSVLEKELTRRNVEIPQPELTKNPQSVIATDIKMRKPQAVVIKDIDMPFSSMVIFMVKWAIATIPAILILGILGMLVVAFFGAGRT